MSKQIYYEDENFVFSYEMDDSLVLVHCDVTDFKLSSLKKGYEVFANFMNFVECNGVRVVATVTPNPKFARLLGGRTVSTLTHEDKEYEVLVWELK